MIERIETTFLSEADGLSISLLTVRPIGKPKGMIQFAHGMCENKERYMPFMEYLAEKGYLCRIHDHRGHGRSVKSKEDLGYMYKSGANGILTDMRTINKAMHEEYPDLPLIMFGHSMGSLAVRAYAAKYDGTIDALIVCGSPSNNPGRPIGEGIARIESMLLGSKHKSKLLTVMSMGPYQQRFKHEPSLVAWLCTDEQVQKEYEQSEYCGFMFTDDAYLALFQLMKQAYDVKNWKCTNPNLPVLFVSGEEDPCMVNIRQFAKSVKNMRKAGYLDVRGKVYRGMRHEILNEKNHEKVFHDITLYLKKKGF